MEEYENKRKAIKAFEKLGANTKNQALLEMLNSGVIDLAPAMVAYAEHLAAYKHNAQQDMSTLARAGIDLAEKEIKKIPSIKSSNKRELKTAQAYTLISTGVYSGTKFGDELEKRVDIKIVDPKWYEDCWKLKNPTRGLEEK